AGLRSEQKPGLLWPRSLGQEAAAIKQSHVSAAASEWRCIHKTQIQDQRHKITQELSQEGWSGKQSPHLPRRHHVERASFVWASTLTGVDVSTWVTVRTKSKYHT
ncbi:hypothetical protein LEMLEM_LOCUS16213, partial [Lemmus lemmus]